MSSLSSNGSLDDFRGIHCLVHGIWVHWPFLHPKCFLLPEICGRDDKFMAAVDAV
jgi:hypothetical protein